MNGDTDIRPALRHLVANRHSPEARALAVKLMEYAHGRIRRVVRTRYSDLVSEAEAEELVHDVLVVLMPDGLAAFRGHNLKELLAYVRSIADRMTWRHAERRLRERRTLEGEGGDAIRKWNSSVPEPDQLIRLVPDNPLTEQDSGFLESLFQAGSKAELARNLGVSRAAVTQRVQRVIRRMEALPDEERARAEAWVRYVAVREERRPSAAHA